jgi:hypothetical protein
MSKPPAPSRPPAPPQHLYPTDMMPLPEVREESSDTAWELWNDLTVEQEAVFAETAPASSIMPLAQGDPRYAPTVPAALVNSMPAQQWQRTASTGVAIDAVMVEARRNNRLCPKPAPWQRLYALLPNRPQEHDGGQPPPPLAGRAWSSTPSLAKRMCLRDHIEWAETHGGLDAVYSFLKDLPEEQWHHMGD